MLALTQENVHYTLNSDPGVMNKSNKFHARIQDFGQAGWGGVEARRPENSLDNVFLVINLFYSLQSGSNGFITEGRRGVQLFPGGGGVQRNPYNLWFSRGVRTPYPPLDPHVGSPDATVCLQNHGLSKFK